MTITELTPGTKAREAAQRFEVFTGAGRRRDWSDEEKARIVEESYSPDLSVCAVARQHGLSPSQLFAWRRLAREQRQETTELIPMFVPAIAELSEVPPKKVKRSRPLRSVSTVAVIELEIDNAKVRIASGTDFETIQAVISALKASS
jgi:transposase